MIPFIIASIAFASILAGAMLGLLLGQRLPDHHLQAASKDTVKVAMAMIGTMTALVLGLVTASAKSSFDTENTALKDAAAEVLTLDRILAAYGPETKPIRDAMRNLIALKIQQMWPDNVTGAKAMLKPAAAADRIANDILMLTPTTNAQSWYRSRALELCSGILQARWAVYDGASSPVPVLFLVVIICWLTVLFGSFGLFAPRNATVIGALLICTLSVAASIFLILEMDDPFAGVMKISSAPMRYALSQVDL